MSFSRALSVLAWPIRFIALNLYAWWLPVRHLLSPKLGADIPAASVFRVTRPLSTTVLLHWRVPMTDGFRCVLSVGTRLRTPEGASARSRSCTFMPDDRSAFEIRYVPAEHLRSAKFQGVSIPLLANQIRDHLESVATPGHDVA